MIWRLVTDKHNSWGGDIWPKMEHNTFSWYKIWILLFIPVIVHYDTSAIKLFLASVSSQHEPKVSDVITLVRKTFFARVSYKILYHEVWKCAFYTRNDINVIFTVSVTRITVHTVKCTGPHHNFSSATMNY